MDSNYYATFKKYMKKCWLWAAVVYVYCVNNHEDTIPIINIC